MRGKPIAIEVDTIVCETCGAEFALFKYSEREGRFLAKGYCPYCPYCGRVRSELREKLLYLREEAIKKGMRLLTED